MRLAQPRPSVDEQRVQMRFAGVSATETAMEYAMRFESPMTKFSNVSVEVMELFGARLTGLAAIGRGGLRGRVFRVGSEACRDGLVLRCACGAATGAAPACCSVTVAGAATEADAWGMPAGRGWAAL